LNVVVLSRHTYRKGMDLLVDIVPEICLRFPHVNWLIGGDGPKFQLLEQMVAREQLCGRVELIGRVEQSSVRDVLVRGHVFLNTSLTEAFCIANVEAAACGLFVVSTNVGGVPEVLPPDMVCLAEPNSNAVIEALDQALKTVPSSEEAWRFHEDIRHLYSWHDVAERTERVYKRVQTRRSMGLCEHLLQYLRVGPVSGKICILMAAFDILLCWLLEWLQPADGIESAAELPWCRRPCPQSPADSAAQRRASVELKAVS